MSDFDGVKKNWFGCIFRLKGVSICNGCAESDVSLCNTIECIFILASGSG